MQDRVTICGGVLGGHPRLVADAILALSVANCRNTWRWRDGSSARIGAHRTTPWDKPKWPIGKVHSAAGEVRAYPACVPSLGPRSGLGSDPHRARRDEFVVVRVVIRSIAWPLEGN